MADSIVGGMFGISPEIFQQSRDEQIRKQALEFSKLDPYERTNAMAFIAGRGLGNIVGGALGAEDPQLRIISARNAVMREVDPNNPESIQRGIQRLASEGDQRGALELSNYLRKAQSENALIQQRTAEKMTPEQRNALASATLRQQINQVKAEPDSDRKTNTLAFLSNQLSALITPKPDKVADVIQISQEIGSLTTQLQTLKAMGQDKGSPEYDSIVAQIKRLDNSKDKISPFAQTLIDAGIMPETETFKNRMNQFIENKLEGEKKGSGNVIIGGITIDSGAASKEAGKNIGAKVANIEDQYSLQTAIQDATKLVGQGIYAGAFGPEKGFIAKYSGGMIGDSKKVQNTEVFLANIGEIVIPRLQQFGGNDSNEELKYLQKVVAGEQRLEPESMKRILESAEKKTRNNIARLQKQVETGKTGGDLPLQPMQPAPSAPRVTKRLNPATGKIESVTGE
jgi:hypothetical protein